MVFEFKLPDLGEGVAEGEVLEWHVAAGDAVAEDDVLAEVETDKAAVDVPSPVDGVVTELRYEVGDVVEVGEVLVTIDEGDESDGEGAAGSAAGDDEAGGGETATSETDTTGEATRSAKGGRVFAPPNVRRLAREVGVDITTVAGSGPSGRVTEADVRAAAEAGGDGDGTDGSDGKQLKSAVSRVGGSDGETDDTAETKDGAETGDDADEGGDDEPKSAVQRVDEPGPESEDDAAEPAVKSAVKKAGDRSEGTRDQTLATPATRQVARELGVDVDAVPTDESRNGEAYVSEQAVRAYAEQRDAEDVAVEASVGDEPTTETAGTEKPTRREPYRGVRRTIGEQMQRSRRDIPHATHHDLADASALVDARERLKPLAEERGVRLTYLPFVLKSVAAALREHPILNTELDEEAEEIVYKEYYDVGVATATDAGLMVPVVRDVDDKRILEVATEVNDLVERARDRSIERSEMRGGTFTVTNFGAIGGEFASPIINAPQTAILGIGALKERAVVEDREAPRDSERASGEVVARQTLPLSLAIDHRVVDGADAARFVNTLKEYLADPTLLLLE